MAAHNELTIQGLTELRAALRRLPTDLANEANVIVWARAQEAYRQMDALYAQHDVTGNLRRGLSVSQEEGFLRFGARAVVRNRAPHAYWSEHGTQMRQTTLGAGRGQMRPLHIFIPIAQRQRRLMIEGLKLVVLRSGPFQVIDQTQLAA